MVVEPLSWRITAIEMFRKLRESASSKWKDRDGQSATKRARNTPQSETKTGASVQPSLNTNPKQSSPSPHTHPVHHGMEMASHPKSAPVSTPIPHPLDPVIISSPLVQNPIETSTVHSPTHAVTMAATKQDVPVQLNAPHAQRLTTKPKSSMEMITNWFRSVPRDDSTIISPTSRRSHTKRSDVIKTMRRFTDKGTNTNLDVDGLEQFNRRAMAALRLDEKTVLGIARRHEWEEYAVSRLSSCNGKVMQTTHDGNYYFLAGGWRHTDLIGGMFMRLNLPLRLTFDTGKYYVEKTDRKWVDIADESIFDLYEALVWWTARRQLARLTEDDLYLLFDSLQEMRRGWVI
ncbi:hypothetical protein BJ508DRAFT_313965 [Ascobolus immersus RN42]|uniref:Uncharacterized protein n=1 Tax=Ascobolus immersus RN42 TaxID=1160509 RepID=A0A3N4HN55_ASCIM|nr:hypothetical protein BJ508DRAFT_313965 [Ascobolus immersus RN42]